MTFAFAEFERDLIVERTREGREIAKQKGIRIGRPIKTGASPDVRRVRMLAQDGRYSKAQIAEITGLSRATVYRYLEKKDVE